MTSWQFFLNDQPMSTFSGGALTVPAFSGLGSNVNKSSSACFANQGPIPPGTYHIVDRPTGGRLGWVRDWWMERSNWFGLFADDGSFDDYTLCEQVRRGNFRLHPSGSLGISYGCIVINEPADFNRIRALLLGKVPTPIPSSDLMSYGTVVVHRDVQQSTTKHKDKWRA